MTHWPELRLSVARLRRRDRGELRSVDVESEIHVDRTVIAGADISISTASVPEQSEIHVRGSVTSGVSGIEFRGRISAPWTGACRRCLEPVDGAFDLDVRVLFADDPDHVDDEADTYPIEDDRIDLGAVVYEELMLALPLSPLCEDDCAGSDPERFATGADDPDGADADEEPVRDPRWAALDALTFDEAPESGDAGSVTTEAATVDEGGDGADSL